MLQSGPRTRALLLRYEDLIEAPARASARLEAWLDIDLDPRVITDREQFSHHITSTGSSASVGKWRAELPGREAELLMP